jgi:hypothetical protein
LPSRFWTSCHKTRDGGTSCRGFAPKFAIPIHKSFPFIPPISSPPSAMSIGTATRTITKLPPTYFRRVLMLRGVQARRSALVTPTLHPALHPHLPPPSALASKTQIRQTDNVPTVTTVRLVDMTSYKGTKGGQYGRDGALLSFLASRQVGTLVSMYRACTVLIYRSLYHARLSLVTVSNHHHLASQDEGRNRNIS